MMPGEEAIIMPVAELFAKLVILILGDDVLEYLTVFQH